MLKIGEFSKLSTLTVKALRFYEKEKLLVPRSIDEMTGYRMYDTCQLETAALLKALRQLDFSIDEIHRFLCGASSMESALCAKAEELHQKQTDIVRRLSIIRFLLEEKGMKYQVFVKELPACTVYSETRVLKDYSEISSLCLESAEECLRLNPGLQCTKPDYCFCEYLDGEYREHDITTRYSQAVMHAGVSNERIVFRNLPAVKALCVYHRGAYEMIGEAYAYIMNYARANGYKIASCPREVYIDGIWNKSSVDDWLTEIELPIEENSIKDTSELSE